MATAAVADGDESPAGDLPVDIADVGLLRSYLASLLAPVMSATRLDLETTLFSDPGFGEKASRFAVDSSTMVAYITKERNVVANDESEEPSARNTLVYTLHLPPAPPVSSRLLVTLSLIKKRPTLDATTPIADQLHFVLLSSQSSSMPADSSYQEGTVDQTQTRADSEDVAAPYEGLRSLVHFGVTPWFESYINAKQGKTVDVSSAAGKKSLDAQMGIPVAKRKFAELELSLLHLQQNVEIPEVHLVIQTPIQKAVEACREAGTRITVEAIEPQSLLTNVTFLNRLQSDVNSWIKEIQKVTKLSRDVSAGTASQEINFWLSMERALESINAQLAGDEVNLVLDVLKSAKRFHATISFIADTGLKEASDTVQRYNALMKDFPLNDLLSATDLDKIRDSLYVIFGHINKKLKVTPYPLRRTLPLVEAISRDFNDQCAKVLNRQRLMYLDYSTFDRVTSTALEVFAAWEENIKEFTNVAREVMRKRTEKFIAVKINSAHTKLQERISYLRVFRRNHEQLRAMTGPGGGLKALGFDAFTDVDMDEEVSQAYEALKNAQVLDVTTEGTEIWVIAEGAYNERISRVENQIILRLRDRLATARNAHEMFRIFSKFNNLFIRPKIRSAIQEYQTRLIDSVKHDIQRLHQKFTQGYRHSDAFHMSQLRDLPPVASAIIWARQIEKQLNTDMKRVEDVLGKGWEMYADGEKLKTESEAFRKKLNPQPIFDAWIRDVTKREHRASGRLLEIVRQRNTLSLFDGQPALELAVNFDHQTIALFKEVRNLVWLNYNVPHTVVNMAKEAKRIYPHAASLMESLRIYTQTSELVERTPDISILLAEHRLRAQDLIGKGMNIRWENIAYSFGAQRSGTTEADAEGDSSLAFFKEFANVVGVLQEKSIALVAISGNVTKDIEELSTCPYTFDAFAVILSRLQKTADDLNLQGFANLDAWIDSLDQRIQRVLLQRLSDEIENWCKAFSSSHGQLNGFEDDGQIVTFTDEPIVHELRMKNQLIYVEPPVEMTQATWTKQLQRIMGIVCGQTAVTSLRYELKIYEDEGAARTTYQSILSAVEDSLLLKPFQLIKTKVEAVRSYVAEWLRFQSLWDLHPETIYGRLGEELDQWSMLLSAIKQSRSTFDTAELKKDFGVCLVVYAGVQGKVTAKYDSWQRDILTKYGAKLGYRMTDFHVALSKARQELESQTLNGSSTAQAVSFITFVQDLNKKNEVWTRELRNFVEGQQLLEKQRYTFPDDWLHIDRISGEWQMFNDILKRKNDSIQDQYAALQLKISAEVEAMDQRINILQQDWDTRKPIQGTIKAELALDTIETFSSRLAKTMEGHSLLGKAQDALNLNRRQEERLDPMSNEIRDLKTVWTALLGISIQLNELRETLWTAINPRKLRQSLDSILLSMKEMPSRMRQYAAYEHFADILKGLLKGNSIVSDLKSDALRDRHWRTLFQLLRMPAPYRSTSMTLGDIWDLNTPKNERELKGIILQAQGEMALEEYIRQVKDTWSTYTLDLTNYRNKCRLIRGWEELFTTCRDQVTSLGSMRASPYYKVFEEEACALEDKLNRVHSLFDIWVDVQRQWVYLEGVFAGNADIAHLLPVESSRFNSINSEFLMTMAKVSKSPLVFDVIAISGILKTLERLLDALAKIQKGLGEYLERERAAFPRYFFLGDEDLLEIIGNSKDISRVAKHMGKMFAGIRFIHLNDAEDAVIAISSKENERINLVDPIYLDNKLKVNDWLTSLERSTRATLRQLLRDTCHQLREFYAIDQPLEPSSLLSWIESFPDQLVILAFQISWTGYVERQLNDACSVEQVLELTLSLLDRLSEIVLQDLDALVRRKCEHLIIELAHQRDILRTLLDDGVTAISDFVWQKQMRFYHNFEESDVDKAVLVKMADAVLPYGFEYLGIPERLVQTPLTDKCYLVLTQALHSQCGGSPFGPAGTGKTESVKALGAHLGKFVLVFCCDETFDFQAMGRIFSGICQVGAWGCFDEFNRLEEKMLSAVSQQIQTIQHALDSNDEATSKQVILSERRVLVRQDTGIFITMNPDYAGRSQLPSNLKKLFRSVAMTHPDRQLIAQVTLFAQGFRHAEAVAAKVVPFFQLCQERLSKQAHYDFGLRALKSVLIRAGILKRLSLVNFEPGETRPIEVSDELGVLLQSIREALLPKLIGKDVQALESSILQEIFPGITPYKQDLEQITDAIRASATQCHLSLREQWMAKIVQLYQIQQISHGIMLVGGTATGKSQAWRTLLKAMEHLDGVESVAYLIDPKAISKDSLYGILDVTTREWTDGLFTSILRKILEDARGESTKRHFIVFDGDVDPEWIENLNSVLDDNKLLTLPNGERLNLPHNVRVLFEVENLDFATPATVSRCGMVWFSEDVLDLKSIYQHYMTIMEKDELQLDDADIGNTAGNGIIATQKLVAQYAREYIDSRHLLDKAVTVGRGLSHIMHFDPPRCLSTLFSSLSQNVRDIYNYDQQHPDFPLTSEKIKTYLSRKLLLDIIWAFAGDADTGSRSKLSQILVQASGVEVPSSLTASESLLNYTVDISTGIWLPWADRVPTMEVDVHNITATDVVIPTVDTLRHEALVYSWIRDRKPVILCGPPGSGKTMTLFNALRKLPNIEVAGLNFSSATSPELILRTFEQYCEYRKTPKGTVLSPTSSISWLMVFCDEINLPASDTYGTQRVISFIRQMVEAKGFWRTSDLTWIHLERVQFIGACNPPTDSGRTELSSRFLRHAPVLYVDYPEVVSLNQIYSTYVRALLKVAPDLRGYAQPLTQAMVDFYQASKRRFTPDQHAHYIYSPRELTRWVRGIYETLRPLEGVDLEGLVRIWAHEALRLFQDRLVDDDEKRWTDDKLNEVAMLHFPTIDQNKALSRPILFSNWVTQHYQSIERDALRDYTKARLRTFYEEEMDVQLVLFDDVLDHVLRIDRVFRQSQGHMLLIGVSGGGKTTLSRFVAWMNGLSIYQLQVSSHYSASDFDDDLRHVLRRAGCKGEKICFIMDESNVLDSGFLERMNTLLANAEIPGLFDGDEYTALMTACREGSQRDGHILDSNDELYRWFTRQIASNLHVVFTMNPPAEGMRDRVATSPALFNRCVLDWFGSWSRTALNQVATELTAGLDLDKGDAFASAMSKDLEHPSSYSMAVVNVMVHTHELVLKMSMDIVAKTSSIYHVTPRHFLDFIAQFVKLYLEKKEKFEEQQRHINVGLEKLEDTLLEVGTLQSQLNVKDTQLKTKDAEANRKLRQMVADQQEAEAKKLRSIQIQHQLEQQQAMIDERKEGVLSELEDVEPMVQEAAGAVANIKKAHLAEVRAMGNPPETVKIAVESACIVLGFKVDGWKAVQSVIRRDDFTSMVRNFDSEKISATIRAKIERDYMSLPNFTVEAADRASKACGPLVQWVFAQVRYSAILDKVGPLRDEVTFLEHQAETTKEQAKIAVETVQQLEESISQYKDEYAQLITETQTIKLEMRKVQDKVTRSTSLLSSLSSEQERWTRDSQLFETEIANIPGDVLLSSVFLTYAGWFDQQNRLRLVNHTRAQMSDLGILYKSKLSFADFLSSIDERSGWSNAGLAVDDLTVENALILKRFNRYPLIIDPTDQATTFLTKSYSKGKMIVTSFLDSAFIKNLETALRFGNALLIQNAEDLNPILNAVLNKEIRRTGGRNLVRLGNQDVDFSPAFVMFLSTRDASIEIGPDVSSRTTIVNFSMTPSSLFSQSLDKILKVESPETYARRKDLQKIQSGYLVKLRHLEESLLQVLNECDGHILEDDKVITTLETVKREAAIVVEKVADAETVMDGIEEEVKEYTSIARAASDIFFLLARLPVLHHFYRFSLDFFLHIFDTVLSNNPRLRQIEDPSQRHHAILEDLFATTIARVKQALLHEDHSVLSLFLTAKYLSADGNADKAKALLHFMRSSDDNGLSVDEEPHRALEYSLKQLPFEDLGVDEAKTMQQILEASDIWQEWLVSAAPELQSLEVEDLDDIAGSIIRIDLISRLRKDRLDNALRDFAGTLIQTKSNSLAHDMELMVKHEVSADTPIIFASIPGHDASSQVEALVVRMKVTCTSVAMGSEEGISAADQAISIAARNGTWVLLKNLHLASHWLHRLERRLRSLTIHPDFRLFLTMETTASIPASIIETSRIVMNEPTPGIRANLSESLDTIQPDQRSPAPAERDRLYFLLAWLHTILLERTRYLPIGFTKSYGFNDSDLAAGKLMLDRWIGYEARGRSNVDPESLPWDAIRTLLLDNIYGGKVDTPEDLATIRSFVHRFMNADAFDSGFSLTPNGESPEISDISRFEQFVHWAAALPNDQPVSWLDLPAYSDQVVAAKQGRDILAKCTKLWEGEGCSEEGFEI